MNRVLQGFQLFKPIGRKCKQFNDISNKFLICRQLKTTGRFDTDNDTRNETGLVTCDLSHDNKIAVVSFNAPSKLNALTVPLGAAFKTTLHDLSTQEDLRAVILTGKGR